jgi:hypothetical protein
LTNNRLRHLISSHLGKPYLLGACGEGPDGRYDQKPLCRTDAFDCLTYVNYVLAQYFADGPDDILSTLLSINYSSDQISYFTRCHYMTSDWLPTNLNANRLNWITDELGFKTQTVLRDFDRGWFFKNRTRADLHLLKPVDEETQNRLVQELQNNGPRGNTVISVTYIGWRELQENSSQLKSQLPAISIMLVVRPGDDYVHTSGMITHLGFVLNEQDDLYFVHAKHKESVQQEKLLDYFVRFKNNPTIGGAAFLEVKSL